MSKESYWNSKIAAYQTCPRMCKLQFVDKVNVDAPESGALHYGSALHMAIEAMFEGRDPINTFDIYWHSMTSKYVDYGRDNWAYLLECGHTHIQKFQRYYFKKFTPVSVEERLHGKIGQYAYEGTYDLVAKYEGKLTLIDWKTSGYPYDKDKIDVADQLYRYAHLWHQLKSKRVRQVMYLVFVKRTMSIQKPLIKPLTKSLMDSSILNAKQWMSRMASDKDYPKNRNACIRGPLKCAYLEVCGVSTET